ncbi:hypothetical protein EDC18_103278 [Natranaerovirga pectinivora]|uniref:DUF3021 family protein n=1 Tax=Natranaerovirga pectinivora TaxID=682400 RepID=A0A4R3MLK0_9FIRM|nr:hypothetical protein EDC18_103278 [Natranaerovirga pectinivora]
MFTLWTLISLIISVIGTYVFYPNYSGNAFPFFMDIAVVLIFIPSTLILNSLIHQFIYFVIKKTTIKYICHLLFVLYGFYLFNQWFSNPPLQLKLLIYLSLIIISYIHFIISLSLKHVSKRAIEKLLPDFDD